MDSVAAMWTLLEETPYVLHGMHFRMINRMGRYGAELDAVAYCREWFEERYPDRVEFSMTSLDVRALPAMCFDVFPVMMIAAAAGLSLGVEHGYVVAVAGGHRWCDPRVDNHPSDPNWPRVQHDAYYAHRHFHNRAEFKPFLAPLVNEPRAETIARMPKDLLLRCWTCRTPRQTETHWIPCGTCESCEHIRSSGHPHHELAKRHPAGSARQSPAAAGGLVT